MKFSTIIYFLFFSAWITISMVAGTGCAQIGAPTGGPKDTIPPRLLSAAPKLNSTNFKGNKISFTFNEYVTVEDIQNNLLVSPLPKINPVVDYKLKTVTVKLKDTLLPNTTYAINFGNAIRDNNEGNPLKNFTYVFSTGNTIDSLKQSGKVILAETGKTDSTLVAMLYRSLADSAVQKKRPDYIAKLNGDGSFTFINLSPGTYKIYALKDGDGGKTYNSKAEQFAFLDKAITVSENGDPVTLYAYAEEKETKGFSVPPSALKLSGDKKLKYTVSVAAQNQDLLDDLELSFNKPLKKFDPAKIILADTNYKPVSSARVSIDSTKRKVILSATWQAETQYRLIVNNGAVADSSGTSLAKTDTIRFTTKKESEYGNLVLRFSGLDFSKHPVLQFVSGESMKESYPVTTNEWKKPLFKPGEYEIRILYDDNNNGKWDPGSYSKKRQPEKVISLPQRLAIKANWDNERDIKL